MNISFTAFDNILTDDRSAYQRSYLWLDSDEGASHNAVDLPLNHLTRDAGFLEMPPQRFQAPFAANTIHVAGYVPFHLPGDAEVRQVHASVFERRFCFGVRSRRKTNEAVIVHVDAQRLEGRDGHVDAQVKLVGVNQQRLLNVTLHDQRASLHRYSSHKKPGARRAVLSLS